MGRRGGGVRVPVEINLWLKTNGVFPLEGTYKIERERAGSGIAGFNHVSDPTKIIIARGRENRKGEGLFSISNLAVCFFVCFFHFGGSH